KQVDPGFGMVRRRQRRYLPGLIHHKRKIGGSRYSINNPQPLPLPLSPSLPREC
ncbi:hypothetical protein M408DRAFT_332368, partial [Serendipita vermifera MAFF 305830]